jgi:uncharacterized protein with GYD domain
MPKYLFRASLTGEGVAGIVAEGASARREVVSRSIETLGGTVEAFYFAFGDEDVILIADLPDNETAAAFALETSASGTVGVATTVLITPEEVDRARAKRSGWRAPGAPTDR